MQTLTRPPKISGPLFQPRRPRRPRRRRFSPLVLIGAAVTVVTVLGAGAFLVMRPHLGSHAANVNMDCTLIVPPQPLTAQGLATPYQLRATNPDNGPCNEANANQSAFVEAAILDPATGQISIYSPLVIDQNTQPAAAPVKPNLPQNAVVGIWFGFNGNNLTLRGKQGSLQQSNCVNGLPGSVFGQFAYCNAVNFFNAANQAIAAGILTVPALGMANDGQMCPTTRDFSVVDMDQSDNLPTQYIANADGQTAQLTAANMAAIPNATVLGNPSDNALLDKFIDPALGCQPWMAPNLADPGRMVPSLALDELLANAHQPAPVALVPLGDDMTVINGQPSLKKTNLYRAGVDQPPAPNQQAASTTTYCQNILAATTRINNDATLTKGQPSPMPAAASNLFNFLAMRLQATLGPNGLNCTGLLNIANPVTTQTDGNGVVISATINTNGTNQGANAPNCVVNNQTIAACNGTAAIGNQNCTFAMNANNSQVNINCTPAQGSNNNGSDNN
jgi:hypothetical protein